jgi:hypothetical protein
MLDTGRQATEFVVTVLYLFGFSVQNLVEFQLRRPRALKLRIRLLPHFQLIYELLFFFGQRTIEEHFVLIADLQLLTLRTATQLLLGIETLWRRIRTKL